MSPSPFGPLLRSHRERRGLSRPQLAEKLAGEQSRSWMAIRQYEYGSVGAPDRETVLAIADALEIEGEERVTFLDAAGLYVEVVVTDSRAA